MSAAPPPYDAGPAPKSASPDGGAYASRYRDRGHVTSKAKERLPPGVVPSAVRLGLTRGLNGTARRGREPADPCQTPVMHRPRAPSIHEPQG